MPQQISMFSEVSLLLSLALMLITAVDTTTSNIRINSANSRFIDEYGRERIFHGVNAVYKVFPYLPVPPATWVIDGDTIDQFKYYGINVLRLGLMFSGTMPSKGEINTTYLDSAEQFVKLCQDKDMYVLLDSHQDLYAEEFGGDGFPSWSVIKGDAEPFPYPLKEGSNVTWGLYYMTEIVNYAFGNFFSNTDNLQNYYSQFWRESAKRFAKYAHVLGYELINEPWCGNIYQDPSILLPSRAYSQNLEPLYDVLAKEIWSQDPDHLVFFESVTWDETQSGMSHVPGNGDNGNKTVLSYHYYAPPQISVLLTLLSKFETRKEFGCGSMMTEFEIWKGENRVFKKVLELADEWKESWIGWLGNPLQLFTQSDSFLATFAHPYPQIVAGRISKMNFEPETNTFTLRYTTNEIITSNESVIFVNKDLHYPQGFKVTSVPADSVNIVRDDANHHVKVYHDPDAIKNYMSVTVTIAPVVAEAHEEL